MAINKSRAVRRHRRPRLLHIEQLENRELLSTVGTFEGGQWRLDSNNNHEWDGSTGGDMQASLGELHDVPIAGDWSGLGHDQIGVYRAGLWLLDANDNRTWDTAANGDQQLALGGGTNRPVVGDWAGLRRDQIGVFRAGVWQLDTNGNGRWDGAKGGDMQLRFVGSGNLPVVGDWNGDGKDEIGVYYGGKWRLDTNGNGRWDGPKSGDTLIRFGTAGDVPVVGDWNGDGRDEVGVYRKGKWILNTSGAATVFQFGPATARPIVLDLSPGSPPVVNHAPVLGTIGNKTVQAGSQLTFTATATDQDVPPQTLAFSLDAGAPAGAAINGLSGVFSWTPTAAQASNSYNITVRVTDNGSPNLSDTKTFSVTVQSSGGTNHAPVLAAIGNKTVLAGNALAFTATATDQDVPPQTLTFSLDAGAPAGAAINGSSGAFSWTPTAAQANNAYSITVRVTDNGSPNRSDDRTISVTVQSNHAPVLRAIGNKTVQAGSQLTFTATASDQDAPPQTLAFSLDAGAPAGAAINGSSGAFSWTPTAAQANNTYSITVRVTDNGSPNLSDSETISVTVQGSSGTNLAPVLATIGNKAAQVGSTLSFTATATDTDVPPQALAFSLDTGAPAGATINATSGVFSWTPTSDQANNSYSVTVRVTDNGSPNLSDSETIIISVRSNTGNSAPIITGVDSRTVPEGQMLRIPFTVLEPDNDVVDRSVSYLINGVAQAALPKGAQYDAKERVFSWWPDFDQAGTHTFRFTATDEFGASDTETSTITVTDLKDKPAVWVMDSQNTTGVFGIYLLAPDEIYTPANAFNVQFKIGAFDAEGDPVSLDIQGLPGATLTRTSVNPPQWEWNYALPDNDSARIYPVTVVISDNKGNSNQMTVNLDLRPNWSRGLRLITKFINGVHQGPTVATSPRVIAKGTLDIFGLDAGKLNEREMNADGVTFRYLLDGQPIGPAALTANDHFFFDSTKVSDGSHLLEIQPLAGSNLEAFRVLPALLIVDNVPGGVEGAQDIPIVALNIESALNNLTISLATDWIHFPGGSERPHNTANPYPYQFIPPASTLPDPSILRTSGAYWFVEPMTQLRASFANLDPRIYRAKNGVDLVVNGFHPRAGVTTESAYPFTQLQDDFDGGRDDNTISGYSVLIPSLTGPDWYGIDINGRFFEVTSDGAVETLAGWVTRRDIIPAFENATIENAYANQKVLIGTFQNNLPFKMSNDVAVDPRDPKVFYVADTGNSRIAKIDLHGPAAVVTTYAGTPGVAGYQDGPASQAKFNGPYSIAVAADGTVYVADRWNAAVRKITTNGTVSTLIGGSLNPGPIPDPAALSNLGLKRTNPAWAEFFRNADGPFGQATLTYPMWIRLDSHGDLLVVESEGRALRKIDVSQRTVKTMTWIWNAGGAWATIAVDTHGTIGPVDDIYYGAAVQGAGYNNDAPYNANIQHISADGSFTEDFLNNARVGEMLNSHEHQGQNAFGHYQWTVAVDDEEARLVTQGFGGMGPSMIRLAQPGDPPFHPEDEAVFQRGFEIHMTGTVPGFPLDIRPSFSILHGARGHASLGGIQHFDDLAQMTDQQIADYVHAGMGGSVPRPELTGNALRDYIYYIRKASMQGGLADVRPGPDSLDVRPPEVRNVRVTQSDRDTIKIAWQTDEPTIGLIQYGPTTRYGLYSEIESGYSKDHEMLLRAWIPGVQYHFTIRAKDFAGNQTSSTDSLFAGSSTVGSPPPVGPIIVDDGGQGSSLIGAGWTGASSGYGSHSLVAALGVGLNTAVWQATDLPVGSYAIQATWTANASRASNALFRISDGDKLVQTVLVNQRSAPQGVTINGVTFQTLATVQVSGGTLRVTLTDQADGSVLADAIRVVAI